MPRGLQKLPSNLRTTIKGLLTYDITARAAFCYGGGAAAARRTYAGVRCSLAPALEPEPDAIAAGVASMPDCGDLCLTVSRAVKAERDAACAASGTPWRGANTKAASAAVSCPEACHVLQPASGRQCLPAVCSSCTVGEVVRLAAVVRREPPDVTEHSERARVRARSSTRFSLNPSSWFKSSPQRAPPQQWPSCRLIITEREDNPGARTLHIAPNSLPPGDWVRAAAAAEADVTSVACSRLACFASTPDHQTAAGLRVDVQAP